MRIYIRGFCLLDGVNHHHILPVLRLTKRCPSVFILAVLVIIDRERKGVTKYGRRELEAHLVIGEIAARLRWIPVEMIDELLRLAHAMPHDGIRNVAHG